MDWHGERGTGHARGPNRQLDSERVLVLVQLSGRGKTSGLALEQMRTKGASVLHARGGKVTRFVLFWNRDRGLADLGLASEGETP
jgi:hypothetical protein